MLESRYLEYEIVVGTGIGCTKVIKNPLNLSYCWKKNVTHCKLKTNIFLGNHQLAGKRFLFLALLKESERVNPNLQLRM